MRRSDARRRVRGELVRSALVCFKDDGAFDTAKSVTFARYKGVGANMIERKVCRALC